MPAAHRSIFAGRMLSSCCPTNSVKALKAIVTSSLKDVDITQPVSAIYPHINIKYGAASICLSGLCICISFKKCIFVSAYLKNSTNHIVSDIAVFVLKRDVKLQLTHSTNHYSILI